MRKIAIAACLGCALVASSAPLANDAAYPGADGRIVFVRQVSGPSPSGVPLRSHALYTIRPDGTDERLLLDAAAWYPAWSPDGENVVFSNDVDPSNSSASDWELFLVPADGSRLKQLTFDATAETSPSWSPDGSRSRLSAAAPSGECGRTARTSDWSFEMRSASRGPPTGAGLGSRAAMDRSRSSTPTVRAAVALHVSCTTAASSASERPSSGHPTAAWRWSALAVS